MTKENMQQFKLPLRENKKDETVERRDQRHSNIELQSLHVAASITDTTIRSHTILGSGGNNILTPITPHSPFPVTTICSPRPQATPTNHPMQYMQQQPPSSGKPALVYTEAEEMCKSWFDDLIMTNLGREYDGEGVVLQGVYGKGEVFKQYASDMVEYGIPNQLTQFPFIKMWNKLYPKLCVSTPSAP
jgi:hypothetical protein